VKPDDPLDRSNRPTEASASLDRAEDARQEAEWVARAQRGDTAAFRELVERHRDRIYGLVLRMVRSADDAEEVAQDAFVRAWRALPRFRGEAAFATWLHRIAARLAADRAASLGRRRGREAPLDDPRAVTAEAPEHRGSHVEAARIEALMERLTMAQRAVVTLYYYQDRSVEDVARLLGMPENTVKTHLSRARAALRTGWLESEGL
jgi:RNA polymerase sigma-70 factor (ECF subfamily)